MASSHYFDDGQGATRDKRADCDGLFVEPYIFPARSVEDAVDHHDLALDVGPHTAAAVGVKDDRPRVLLDQFAPDLPQYLLPARRWISI
jgi:hypothetical protein